MEDLRQDWYLQEMLVCAIKPHPRAGEIRIAWARALDVENQGLRSRELRRIAALIKSGVGQRTG